jgi:hypothetical protein
LLFHVFATHHVPAALIDEAPLVAPAGRIDLDHVGVERHGFTDQPHRFRIGVAQERAVAHGIARFVNARIDKRRAVARLLPVHAVAHAGLREQRSEQRHVTLVFAQAIDLIATVHLVLRETPFFDDRRRARPLAIVVACIERAYFR